MKAEMQMTRIQEFEIFEKLVTEIVLRNRYFNKRCANLTRILILCWNKIRIEKNSIHSDINHVISRPYKNVVVSVKTYEKTGINITQTVFQRRLRRTLF